MPRNAKLLLVQLHRIILFYVFKIFRANLEDPQNAVQQTSCDCTLVRKKLYAMQTNNIS